MCRSKFCDCSHHAIREIEMSDKKGDAPKDNPAKNISTPSLPTKQTRTDDEVTKPQRAPRNGIEYRSK